MSRPAFEFLDHTADVKVRVFGETLPRLFENAALAMFSVIAELSEVQPRHSFELEVEGEDRVALLVNWLRELLFRFDTEHLLPCVFEVAALDEGRARGVARGEPLDLARHKVRGEVKAVTYHEAKVEELEDGWAAELVFDV